MFAPHFVRTEARRPFLERTRATGLRLLASAVLTALFACRGGEWADTMVEATAPGDASNAVADTGEAASMADGATTPDAGSESSHDGDAEDALGSPEDATADAEPTDGERDGASDAGIDAATDAVADGQSDSATDASPGGQGDSGTDASPAFDAGPAPTGELTLRAGVRGGLGNADGTKSEARFAGAYQLAADALGNVFVADKLNCTLRKVTPQGVVTTLAGQPGDCVALDGAGAVARFRDPRGVAVGKDGTVYVIDGFSLRTVSAAGVVTTWVGDPSVGGLKDAVGSAARFGDPYSIALDSDGNVFVADPVARAVRRVDPAGAVTTFAGVLGAPGCTNGTGSGARFDLPAGIATDSAGNVYVGDESCYTIRKIDPSGVVTDVAGTPGNHDNVDGTGAAAHFGWVTGLAATETGVLFVADASHHTIRRVSSAGETTTIAGLADETGVSDGVGPLARFNQPTDITLLPSGDLMVADTINRTLRLVTTSGAVSTFAGLPSGAGSADGVGAGAQFRMPAGRPAFDPSGNLVVPDSANHTIRLVSAGGVVTTIAGTAGQPGNADGSGSAARFRHPGAVAVDVAGNIFVADTGNHLIRRIAPNADVSTVAGSRITSGTNDGTGQDAEFNFPSSITISGSGILFIADSGNGTIRRIDAGAVVSTVAGSPGARGYSDGFGNAATFTFPLGVAIGPLGDLFIIDGHALRKLDSTGGVTTLAGAPAIPGSADGIGADARLNFPEHLAVAPSGTIFLADSWNCTVRRFANGALSTVVGVPGRCGVKLGALPAELNEVVGIAVSPSGGLVLASENALLDVTFK